MEVDQDLYESENSQVLENQETITNNPVEQEQNLHESNNFEFQKKYYFIKDDALKHYEIQMDNSLNLSFEILDDVTMNYSQFENFEMEISNTDRVINIHYDGNKKSTTAFEHAGIFKINHLIIMIIICPNIQIYFV